MQDADTSVTAHSVGSSFSSVTQALMHLQLLIGRNQRNDPQSLPQHTNILRLLASYTAGAPAGIQITHLHNLG